MKIVDIRIPLIFEEDLDFYGTQSCVPVVCGWVVPYLGGVKEPWPKATLRVTSKRRQGATPVRVHKTYIGTWEAALENAYYGLHEYLIDRLDRLFPRAKAGDEKLLWVSARPRK